MDRRSDKLPIHHKSTRVPSSPLVCHHEKARHRGIAPTGSRIVVASPLMYHLPLASVYSCLLSAPPTNASPTMFRCTSGHVLPHHHSLATVFPSTSCAVPLEHPRSYHAGHRRVSVLFSSPQSSAHMFSNTTVVCVRFVPALGPFSLMP